MSSIVAVLRSRDSHNLDLLLKNDPTLKVIDMDDVPVKELKSVHMFCMWSLVQRLDTLMNDTITNDKLIMSTFCDIIQLTNDMYSHIDYHGPMEQVLSTTDTERGYYYKPKVVIKEGE